MGHPLEGCFIFFGGGRGGHYHHLSNNCSSCFKGLLCTRNNDMSDTTFFLKLTMHVITHTTIYLPIVLDNACKVSKISSFLCNRHTRQSSEIHIIHGTN